MWPLVIDKISSKNVLTNELVSGNFSRSTLLNLFNRTFRANLYISSLTVSGIPIDKVAALSQEIRNYVGKKLLELTLKELFVFRFMQAGVFSYISCSHLGAE